MGYSYEYEWDKEYCYPNSNVLINKLGIKNQYELITAEREITSLKIALAKVETIKGNLDFEHLKNIHKFIFEDIYTWAGEIRRVNISKGNQFCLSQNIELYASAIFAKLKADNYLIDYDGNIAHCLAYYLSEINVLHPFREGNGRTQRVFIEYLADHAGYKIDFSNVTQDEMIIASAEAFAYEYDKINAMFDKITTKK
ncbi:MAG: Fic family protein [Clostridiales bacterium]|nr:Fic family protein [Clostridiales bacterium]